MSSKIDERVVQMKFNGDQFSAGVAATSSALDRLKSALKMDGAAKDLQNLDGAVKNVNINGLASNVDQVSSRFSALQVIGIGALVAIGQKAIEIGQTMVQSLGQSLTRDMQAGFSDYNKKLTSVQTIMNATGADISVVNGFFKELDTYADKTVYNLDDMTGAFAKFTNAGVDMDKSVPAIKGIANMVALAGQGAGEASIAMYNLSQSIAGGFLTTTDYKSLNLANVATKEWKDNMIQAAVAAGNLGANADGTYTIMSDGSGKVTTAAALFNEELSRGWASADILLGVLGDYGDETTAIGAKALAAAQNVKSLPMMMETLAAAAGTGWTDTFEILLGDVTEATALFSYLTGEIGGFTEESANARNEQLLLWESMGGREAIVEAIHNAFAALDSVMRPLKEAFASVFPPSLGNTLAQLSFGIRDFTKGLILSEGAQKNLKMVATGVFTVLKFGIDIIKGIGSVIGFLIGLAFDLGGAIFSIIGPILTFVRSLMPVQEGAAEATSSVQGFFDMLIGAGKFLTGWIVNGLNTLGELFNNFLNSGGAVKRVKEFQEAVKGVGEVIAMVYNVLAKGDFTGNPLFQEDDKFVDILFRIREGVIAVVGAFQDFGATMAEAGGRAKSFWSGIGGVVQKVWEFIKPVVDGIKQFFGDVMAGLDLDTVLATVNTGVLIGLAFGIGKIVKGFAEAFGEVGNIKKSFISALDELGGALGRFGQETKADQLIKIAGALIILAGALYILSIIDPDRLIGAVAAMATSFGILLGGLAILDKIEAEPSIKASVALSLIAVAVNIMATAVSKLAALDAMALARGVAGVAIMLGVMIVAMQALSSMGDGILKASAALIVMAIALNLLVIPILALGAIPIEMLVQGMAALGIVLFGLVVAAQAMASIGPKMAVVAVGLMAMAVALNLLVIPITTLGLLPFPILLQGMITLGILLAGLTVTALILANIAPTMALAAVGLIAMAVAINLLVAPIALLGAMDLGTLIQGLVGLAVVMALLVVAALAMTGAIAGTVGMIAMAAAILILSLSLVMLAGIGLEGIVVGLIGLVAAVLTMAVISAVLTPLIPVMFGVAGAMAVFGLAAVLIAGSIMIAALAIGLLGPALALLAGGIVVFASVADAVMASVGPMMALGAALIVFGAGAIVAGAGALVLGLGLILLGAGLALVGAVGLIGATALAAVVKSIAKLTEHIPGLLMMTGTFLALGAAVLVLGAGLLVLGAGGLLTALALMMLVPMGALVTMSINMIIKAIERLAPMSGQIASIAASLGTLGDSTKKLASNGASAASGLNAMSMSFSMLTAGAMMASVAVRTMAASVPPSMAMIIAALARMPASFMAFAAAIVVAMAMANSGMSQGAAAVQATAARMSRSIGAVLVNGIAASYGPVYGASVTLGSQMTAGMARGLQNGSGYVSSMASQVARNALNAAKRTLGVASPSKEFTKVGEWSDEGLVNGLRNGIGDVQKAGSFVGNSALNAVRKSLSDAKNAVAMDFNMQPTIRPILDLSAVKEGSGLIGGLLTPPSLKVTDSYAMASNLAVQERTNNEGRSEGPGTGGGGNSVTYNQYITSPKAVSRAEVYRDTKNLISVTKGENPT